MLSSDTTDETLQDAKPVPEKAVIGKRLIIIEGKVLVLLQRCSLLYRYF